MLKFLSLIRRYWNFLLFLFLEVVSVYFIAKSHSTQGLDVINSANSSVAYFYQKETNLLSYFKLKQVNNQLIEENKTLRNQLAEKDFVDSYKNVLASIPLFAYDKTTAADSGKTVVDTPGKISFSTTGPLKVIRYAKYNYIPARVINNSVSNDRINFITINRGKTSGIKPGMAVVGYNGVVGRVEHVSKHFATIASILSYRKVSARLRLRNSYGVIYWKPGEPDYVQMDNMPVTMPIRYHDSVFTTGYGSFPPNIMIGRVHKIYKIRSNNTLSLQIKLSTDFRSLQFVYVVSNEMADEKKEVEAKNSYK